jgi:transcriptional regulator with XRE-family HTH domain
MKNNSTTEVDVGRRLRELRAEKGISIRALAQRSGLNVNTLSLIENDKTSPSVSTLQKVAEALQVPISTFFEIEEPQQSVVFQKTTQHPAAPFTHGTLEDLGSGIAQPGLEPFLIHLDPLATSGETPIVHTGLEFVYCLHNQILYTIEKERYLLEPGDSPLFEAHLPHFWGNPTTLPSLALLILNPAIEDDRSRQGHFQGS